MTVFDVDFNILVKQLLPVRLRLTMMSAWLKCLVAPVRSLYALFMTNRKSNLYFLARNSQVCFLEAALNDTFDNISRRIYISEPPFHDAVYLYLDTEEKDVYVCLDSEIGTGIITVHEPVPLYKDSELYTGSGTSFIVNVPVVLGITSNSGPEARLKALVTRYKLPARIYNINYYL